MDDVDVSWTSVLQFVLFWMVECFAVCFVLDGVSVLQFVLFWMVECFADKN